MNGPRAPVAPLTFSHLPGTRTSICAKLQASSDGTVIHRRRSCWSLRHRNLCAMDASIAGRVPVTPAQADDYLSRQPVRYGNARIGWKLQPEQAYFYPRMLYQRAPGQRDHFPRLLPHGGHASWHRHEATPPRNLRTTLSSAVWHLREPVAALGMSECPELNFDPLPLFSASYYRFLTTRRPSRPTKYNRISHTHKYISDHDNFD